MDVNFLIHSPGDSLTFFAWKERISGRALQRLNRQFTKMISKQEEKRSIITRQNERGTLKNEDYTKEYYQVIW